MKSKERNYKLTRKPVGAHPAESGVGVLGIADLRERAKILLLQNSEKTGGKYVPPSWPHYKNPSLWDACFQAIALAELGEKELAKNELRQFLKWQKEDGFIPHAIYHHRKWYYFEHRLSKKEWRKYHSSFTQPPVLAQAVEYINDPEFTKEVLPKLLKFYCYLWEKYDPDQDNLISINHPSVVRDASPEFKEILPRFKGPFRFLNPWYWPRIWKLERSYQKLDWNIDKIWQADLFNVEDIMFHCIWIEGVRILASLCKNPLAAQNLIQFADEAQEALYEHCWDPKDKIFYSLGSQHRKLKPITISNLFPLILDNLSQEMIDGILQHLTSPKEFWPRYPVPVVSLKAPKPSWFNSQVRKLLHFHWQDPWTWINTNWWVLQGLVKHGYLDIAEELTNKTLEMVEKQGFYECYDPFTGKGIDAPNFGWSTLAITFPRILGGTK